MLLNEMRVVVASPVSPNSLGPLLCLCWLLDSFRVASCLAVNCWVSQTAPQKQMPFGLDSGLMFPARANMCMSSWLYKKNAKHHQISISIKRLIPAQRTLWCHLTNLRDNQHLLLNMTWMVMGCFTMLHLSFTTSISNRFTSIFILW